LEISLTTFKLSVPVLIPPFQRWVYASFLAGFTNFFGVIWRSYKKHRQKIGGVQSNL